jgi:hypothetical protein
MSGVDGSRHQYDAWTIQLLGREAEQILAGSRTRVASGSGTVTGASSERAAKPQTVGRGRVNYRKLQLRWRSAESDARTQLGAFIKAVLADPEVRNNPRFGDVQAGFADLGSLMPDFEGSLADELDRLDVAATDEERKTARAAAIKVIENYQAELGAAETLRELQELSDDEYGGIEFFSGLQVALLALHRELAAGA